MSVTDTLLRAALDRDPARPLLTYYDDATGERTELSATTLDNWVAKTANLAVDLGVQPGDRVAVLLPAHWQTAAVLLAVWAVGGVAGVDPSDAAVTFCDADRISRTDGARGEVVALSLAPLGRGLTTVPPGVVDYAVEVRGHGDRFSPPAPVAGDAPALDCGDSVLSTAAVLSRAAERAGELGLRSGDRVLSTLPWNGPADWLDGWLAPLSAGASLVQCAGQPGDGTGTATLARRAATERVTATIGSTLPEVRTLSR